MYSRPSGRFGSLAIRPCSSRVILGHLELRMLGDNWVESVESFQNSRFSGFVLSNKASDVSYFEWIRIPDRLEFSDVNFCEFHWETVDSVCIGCWISISSPPPSASFGLMERRAIAVIRPPWPSPHSPRTPHLAFGHLLPIRCGGG